MIAAIYARKSNRADGGAGVVRLLGRWPGDGEICYPSVQDLALEIVGSEDLLDTGRLIGRGDRGRLGHGAILPEVGMPETAAAE